MDLDLRQLIRIARRRWWLVLLIILTAGSSAYTLSSRQTPIYAASAVMMVVPGSSSDTNYNSLLATERQAKTYQQLVNTQPMRERVAAQLDVPDINPASVSTTIIRDSQLIKITVTDTDPQRAADTANAFVSEFQVYIQSQTATRVEETRSEIDAQIASLQERQTQLDAQITDLEDDGETAAAQLSQLRDERSTVVEAITQLESDAINVQMQTSAASVTVSMVDPAVVPTIPISPQVVRSTILGALVGLLLAFGLIVLLEYLDNTVKADTDVYGIADAPVLATIPEIAKMPPGGRQVYAISQPRSGAAEAVRLLRANLDFAGATEPIKTVTMTSSLASEGKSTTTSNLGVVLAQSGKAVLLIDADLRKPMQHRIFGVDNRLGLSTLLMHPEWSIDTVIDRVALPGLSLMSSGPIPPNPADLVMSPQFASVIERARAEYDMIIIDAPPLLQATDALIIGSRTDGVVLVCQTHKTRIEAFRHSVSMLRQGKARLIGVVLNRTKGQGATGYYTEYYGADEPAPATPIQAR